ncbi:hypothetical protein PV325_002013 [Microctonus aethiopoides]|nr:hypothetical protein PV325_002013 [Microctonus aethiopoides]
MDPANNSESSLTNSLFALRLGMPKGSQQLCALESVQQFSARFNELQCALRRDKDTLAVLDAALQAGATTEVASSVRDVARLLSEKPDVNCQRSVFFYTNLEKERGRKKNEMGIRKTDSSLTPLLQTFSFADFRLRRRAHFARQEDIQPVLTLFLSVKARVHIPLA